jgi:FKBP-type peptidyl-prolyl cis-trans isomerase
MKFIRNACLITTLLAIRAAAQPNLPPANPATAPTPPMRLNSPMAPSAPPTMPDKDKMSYAIGMYFGNTIKKQELNVDLDTVTTALRDVVAGRTNHMSEEEMMAVLKQLTAANRAKMQEAQREKMAKEGLENKAKGDEFLAKNAKLDGVKTLPNGLQYKVIKDGSGEMPKTNDTVTVTYRGALIDGTPFDSRTNWATPVVGRTIKGWSEILPLMKAGSEWQVVVPPDLGYGAAGRGPKIGPSAVLVFDLELVGIGSPKPTAQAPAPLAISGGPPSPSSASAQVSGSIIKVPSADDLKKGAKIEVITNLPPGQ